MVRQYLINFRISLLYMYTVHRSYQPKFVLFFFLFLLFAEFYLIIEALKKNVLQRKKAENARERET